MAKEKFNWKGLFINEEGEVTDSKPETVESKPASSSNSFPKSSSTLYPQGITKKEPKSV